MHPGHARQENIPAEAPVQPLNVNGATSSPTVATSPLDTLFTTPSYRQNRRVATLDMIVQERLAEAAAQQLTMHSGEASAPATMSTLDRE